MNRCIDCDEPIDVERIEACLDSGLGIPDHCKECAPKEKDLGFIGPEGKTGIGHLNRVDPNNKRLLDDVKRWHRRGAQHCTAG